MRSNKDYRNGLGRGLLIGLVVAAVVMLSFPVVAAVGGNFILGKANTADAVTSLSGASGASLRITNTQPASPALELRVVAGAPPLKVNSTVRVTNLNADRLDGKHASAFALVAHAHTGVYLPLAGMAANSDLLDGLQATAFSPTGHDHDAADLTSGTLSDARYSAIADLAAEGYLDNNAGPDLLTQDQANGRFLGIASVAADSSLLDGLDSTAFARQGIVCPPGQALVGYGRTGPICTRMTGYVTLDSTGTVGAHSSLVLDATGSPVVAYYDTTNQDLKLVRCTDANCNWGTVITVDGAGNVGQYPSLVLDAAGRPVISYRDQGNGDLKLAHCSNTTCSTATIVTVDSAGDVGQYTSLALHPNELPVIAYYDVGNQDLKVALCGDANCSAGNILQTVDAAGSVGEYASLALGDWVAPAISYFDATNGDLKVAACANTTCTVSTITTVDSTGTVGQYTSLVLDGSEYPVVSYYDATNGDLKVAHCGDALCSAGNTLRSVDTSGNVGQYTSLVLDPSGSPVISYIHASFQWLKVAHCGDALCSAGNTLREVDSWGSSSLSTSLVLDASGFPVVSYHEAGEGDLRLAAVVG